MSDPNNRPLRELSELSTLRDFLRDEGIEEEVTKRALARIYEIIDTADRPVQGLPVKGYKPTQPPEAIAAVNAFKELEERVLRRIDALEDGPAMGRGPSVDRRWLAIGRTQLQQAFMALARAVFQPERIGLPEDAEAADADKQRDEA